jgi:hypothetical protein
MRDKPRRTVRSLAVLGAVTAFVLAAGPAAAVQPAELATKPASEPAGQSVRQHTVTLITGDKVTVLPDLNRATVTAAAGRERLRFAGYRIDGHQFVVPEDAQPFVTAGSLDRRLFDVTGLVEAGYDDASSDTLPLIVSTAGTADTAALETAGVRTTRQLGATGATSFSSAELTKAAAGQGWPTLKPGAHGTQRIWLDGRRTPLADQPAAAADSLATTAAGQTGAGVTVAVLGHGTKAAAAITASAPDAELLDGPVCADGGSCTESAIIAGMAWAAAERDADVVNVAVSGLDDRYGRHSDPLRATADQLTEQTGALFVLPPGGRPHASDAALATAAMPQVAGAAARLAQQHPDWRAAELHAALAEPTAEPTTETVTLTVRHVDPGGNPAATAESMVFGLDVDVQEYLHETDGTVQVELPKGTYLLVGDVVQRSDTSSQWHRIVQPKLDLQHDTTVTVDARTTRPVTTTVERPQARTALLDLGFQRWYGEGNSFASSVAALSFEGLFTAHLGPEVAPEEMVSYLASNWAVPGQRGDFLNTPFTYNLLNTLRGRYFTGFHRAATDRELAKVNVVHNQQVPGRRASKVLFAGAPGIDGAFYTLIPIDLPARVTHYVDGGEALWSAAFGEHYIGDDGMPVDVTALGQGYVQYEAGREYNTRWNAAVFGPHFDYQEHSGRDHDFIWFGVPMHTDQEGHRGGSKSDDAFTKLWRNGKLIAEGGAGQVTANVPTGRASFRAEKWVTRPSISDLSTETHAVWTFTSDTTAQRQSLPLWTVRYFPEVDDYNYVRTTPVTALRVLARPQPGSVVGQVRKLTVEISGDQKRSWRRAHLIPTGTPNEYVAITPTPRGAKYISLRAHMSDSNGNTLAQTIINAYRLR